MSEKPLGRVLLLVWLVVNEADKNDCHVVAAESAHGAVVGQTPGHQFFADDIRLKTLRQTGDDEVRYFLKKSRDVWVLSVYKQKHESLQSFYANPMK